MNSFLQFIRFSHTVFALPFALGAMTVAGQGLPSTKTFLFIILAMVFARTAAMTFNRLVDWEIDKRNPRTVNRHLLVHRSTAIAACAISAISFVATACAINSLCGYLSPLALAIVFFYSLTKRFTHAAQFFLGLALAVSPVGAWLAVTGKFALPPLVLALGVLLWVAGFDIIYATQDVEVDRVEGLKSIVVLMGIPASLWLAQILHIGMFLCLILFGRLAHLGIPYAIVLVCIFCALIWEHRIAKRGDLGSIQRAFFMSNAVVGLLFVIGVTVDCLLPSVPSVTFINL